MMEDILSSMRKPNKNLEVKLANSWKSEAEFDDHVAESSKLNGNILHFDEDMPDEIEQDTRETTGTEKNVFLVKLEIGNKTIEDVAIRSDCLLQDVAEELAENEMVKVVYYLQEKIKKGGNNCHASEAQVLVKLRSNWKWIGMDDLVDDTSMTFEEVFANIPDYFNPVLSLAPKVCRKTDFYGDQPDLSSPQSVPSEDPSTLLTELRDLLDKHKANELSKKDSQLEKDIIAHLTCEAPLDQPSQNKIKDLKKYLCGLHKILNSLPLVQQNTDMNSSTNKQDKIPRVGETTRENYIDHNCIESLNESSAAPLSRHRTSFDPVHEVPRLNEWFKKDPLPSKSVINHYVSELNAMEFRQGKSPVTEKAVYIWFKNSRARKEKKEKMKGINFSRVQWMTRLARKAIEKNSPRQNTTRKNLSRQERTKPSPRQKLPSRKLLTSFVNTNGLKRNRAAAAAVDGDPAASVSSGPREITIEATTKNPAFIPDDDIDFKQRVSSFEALGLRHDVLKALDAMNITQPTVIQMVTVPSILQRKHVLSAAQTGSGKTIAYLAPVVHHLREDEERHGIVARLQRPRACVVVPGRELALQVLKVAKSFCHHARFRSIGLIGGLKQKWVREGLKKPVDLIVATPGTLLKYRQKDRLFFSDLAYLVIDEADTMFDSSFKNLTMEILHTVHVRESKPPPPHRLPIATQLTIAGATLPDELIASTLADIAPGITKCTSGLHRVLPHIQHRFIKMNQKDKAEKLVQLLQKDSRQGCRTIVFSNSTSSCDWLGHYLNKCGMKYIRLHGNIPPQIRCERFGEFQSHVADILICTDIASRGLDTSDVSHVINFDFPNSVVDYIHRVGRTGRVTNASQQVTCRATSFVTHNRDARMARAIEIAAKRSESLSLSDSKDRHADGTRAQVLGK